MPIQQLDLSGPLRLAKPVSTLQEDKTAKLTLGQMERAGQLDELQMQRLVQQIQQSKAAADAEQEQAARKAAIDQFNLQQGQPNEVQFGQPGEVNLPPQDDGLKRMPVATGGMQDQPFAPVTIPGAAGQPGFQVTPQTAGQVLATKFRESQQASIADRDKARFASQLKIAEEQAKPDMSATPFEAWRKQNPTLPAEEFLKIEASLKPKTPVAPRTVTTAEGVMQFDPDKNSWFKIGDRPPSQASGDGASASDPKDIAGAIMRGEQPPVLTGLYRDAAPVRAELARNGYDLSTATSDWNATQKNLASMNSAQQLKLRQAIQFTNETLPQIEEAYAEWKKQAGVAGFKILNKANLAAMKQLPGAPGSAATNLDALIGDFTSELGTVYKGGNSSTDESLKLAAQNLASDWNDRTFSDAIKRLNKSLTIRKNSIQQAPQGLSAEPSVSGGEAPEGTIITNAKGEKQIKQGGKWVKQ